MTGVIPHTYHTDSFEDRSVEGLQVNSSATQCILGQLRKLQCFKHAQENPTLVSVLVPTLTLVERLSSLLRSVLFRAFARSCAFGGVCAHGALFSLRFQL